jgi:parallel beta-helix repeat protein
MLDLSDARVLDINDTPIHDCRHNGLAIAIGDLPTGAVGHARIHDVVVSHYQFAGIVVFSPGSTATVKDNSVDAVVDPSTVVATVGIEVGNGAVGKVSDNVIKGNRCSGASLGCGPDDIGIGLVAAGNCCNVHENTIINNTFFGIAIQDSVTELSDDTIRGGAIGVGVIAITSNSTGTLHDERISGTTDANAKAIQCCGFTATVVTDSSPGE